MTERPWGQFLRETPSHLINVRKFPAYPSGPHQFQWNIKGLHLPLCTLCIWLNLMCSQLRAFAAVHVKQKNHLKVYHLNKFCNDMCQNLSSSKPSNEQQCKTLTYLDIRFPLTTYSTPVLFIYLLFYMSVIFWGVIMYLLLVY